MSLTKVEPADGLGAGLVGVGEGVGIGEGLGVVTMGLSTGLLKYLE